MKYVVECCKRIEAEMAGLGNDKGIKWYRPGQFVTYDGHPTWDIEEAHIYDDRLGNGFAFDEPLGSASRPVFLEDYFRMCEVETKRTVNYD